MTVKEAVVERVRRICREEGITMKELARRSGMPSNTMFCMMRSKYQSVFIGTVAKVCRGAGMTLHEFFSSEEFQALD